MMKTGGQGLHGTSDEIRCEQRVAKNCPVQGENGM